MSIYSHLPPKITTEEYCAIMRVTKRTAWKRHRENRGPQPVNATGRLLWDRDEVLAAAGLLDAGKEVA